jgi:hypothetical protein
MLRVKTLLYIFRARLYSRPDPSMHCLALIRPKAPPCAAETPKIKTLPRGVALEKIHFLVLPLSLATLFYVIIYCEKGRPQH